MLFSWANPVRRGAAFVVWHPWFDLVIIVLIVVSSVLLAIDEHAATDRRCHLSSGTSGDTGDAPTNHRFAEPLAVARAAWALHHAVLTAAL